jgi:hypothetical protein
MINAVLWEFLQNVALVAPAIGAIQLWSRGKRAAAAMAVVVTGVLGAALVHLTEPLITGQPLGPIQNAVANAVAFGLAAALFAIYLGSEAEWSSWRIDLGLGISAAVAIAVAQSVTLPDVPAQNMVVHGLAMAVAIPLVLILLRQLRPRNLAAVLGESLLVAAIITTVMVVDYILVGV